MKKKTTQLDIIKQVYDAGLQLLSPSSNEELYPVVNETLRQLIDADYISLYRLHNNELLKVYTSLPQLNNIKVRKDGFTYKSFKEALPYYITNKKVYSVHPELKELGIQETLIIPLVFDKEPIGVISLDFCKITNLQPYEINALELFASTLTYKLQNLDLQKRLKEALDNQKLFISLASHELKNPLTAVLGFASIIERHLKKGKPVQHRTAELLVNEIQRMSQIIDELLDTKNGELERGLLKYQKKQHTMKEIIQTTLSSFSLSHPHRKVLVDDKSADTDTVYVDAQKLKQVITNLLVNAAKFSSDDTQIQVTLSSDSEHVILEVTDHGKGISDTDLPLIFKRFYKGSKNSIKEGMGLGLYLCKQIIEDHNGIIVAHSTVGQGTTMELRLPYYVISS